MAIAHRWVRVLIAACAFALPLGALTACSSHEVTPQAQKTTAYPSLTDKQVKKLMNEIVSTVSKADEVKDANALGDRVEEPARGMRTAQYHTAQLDSGQAIQALPAEPVSVTVTSTTRWPRAIIDVTQAPENGLPYVLIIRQTDAQSPYRLWEWMRLFPGKTIPSTAIVDAGSPAIGNTTKKNLAMSPEEVKQAWADSVLDESTQQKNKFAEDTIMKLIRDEKKGLSDGIGDAGSVGTSIQPGNDIIAVALSEGGAIMATNFIYRTDIAINEGKPGIKLQGNVGKWLGNDGLVTGKAHFAYIITALFKIPSAKAKDESVEMLAGEEVLFEAARD